MNDPNKRIDIDKSSLLSLKAELLRKQQEASQKPVRNIDDHVPKRVPKPQKTKIDSTSKPSEPQEVEDVNLLNKSKRILEAKAKYYNRMTASGGALNSDENCLVMFNQKRQAGFDEKPQNYGDSSSDEDTDYDDDDETKDPEHDWVDYTDCLGRTRKCLRKDLDDFKKRDQALAAAAELRNGQLPDKSTLHKSPQRRQSDDELEEGEVIGPVPFPPPMPVGETFLQQREKWEDQEIKNLHKANVHYQDVLFDEAREHGVGYYGFSNEEDERAKQQKELDKIRAATLAAQQRTDEIRKNREKIIAERVKAAKARQRARQGLPPEEESEQKAEEELYDKTEELERQKRDEAKQRKREAKEKERDRQRQAYVRPWDRNKSDGPTVDDWVPEREREPMTQEQWNTHKREERNMEFAPMPEVGRRPKAKPDKLYSSPPPPIVDMFSVPPPPVPKPFDESKYQEDNRTLFFSTKKPAFKRKNYVETEEFQPGPIRNELLDDLSEPPPPGTSRTRTEIPPPTVYDDNEVKKRRVVAHDIESAITAGLKFLRQQSDKEQFATKNTWTSKADY